MDRYRLGLALVTASAIAWSTAGLFTRVIPLDTWTTLLWRGIFGAAGIFLFILVQERRSALDGFRAMGWPGWSFAVVSAAGMLCFIAALKHTSVAHVAVVYATVPFVAAGLAWLLLREIASLSAILASAAALVGVAVMVGLGADGSLLGDLYAFAMTASMAVMMVIARKHRFIPMLPAACMSALLSAVVAAPFAAWVMPGGVDLLNLALFGLVNSALGLALFTIGSRMIPAAETALIGALDAPLAPVWVFLAFGEIPGKATVAGGGIVFVAVLSHLLSGAMATRRSRASADVQGSR